MSCDLCRRTVRGFFWYMWGRIWWPLTLSVGIPWYFRSGGHSKVACWLVQMYGYVRNPEWLSSNERKWCECRRAQNTMELGTSPNT
jgi:hypothetical protein